MNKESVYKKHFNGNVADFGRVAVLYGGSSSERDVSIQSGTAILEALIACGVDAFGVDVGERVFSQLATLKCDRAFLALHGPGGEDGKIQAILETLNIPYTGSDVASSALAMDKLRSKLVWLGAGLPTPRFVVLNKHENFDEVLQSLGGQAFVKPVKEGSSIGMSLVSTSEELDLAYQQAATYDSCVIAEARVIGKEYTVSVLNGQVLPGIELQTKNTFYDYEAKYLSEETEYLCPCQLDSTERSLLYRITIEAYKAIGCADWGRVDFMQDQNGHFYLLEVNTIPGMTSHSLVPMAAAEARLSFTDLVLEILCGTLLRRESR